MTPEDAQEIVAGLQAGAMLDMPSDDNLRNFWTRLIGSSRVAHVDDDDEFYRPWANYIQFFFRRAGYTSNALARWVKSMVPRDDPLRDFGRLAPARLDAEETAELERAREVDAARRRRFLRNNKPTAVARQPWIPKFNLSSPSSSATNSPTCSLQPSPSSSSSSFARTAPPPLSRMPPPPPPPRSIPSLLSLPFPAHRLQIQERIVRSPPSNPTLRNGLTGELRGDPWAPTPIAVIEREVREAATGVVTAMNQRHDAVMDDLLRVDESRRQRREEAARASMAPEDAQHIDMLERKRRERGKTFPTYASDRKAKKGRQSSSSSSTPTPHQVEPVMTSQDVRVRDRVVIPPAAAGRVDEPPASPAAIPAVPSPSLSAAEPAGGNRSSSATPAEPRRKLKVTFSQDVRVKDQLARSRSTSRASKSERPTASPSSMPPSSLERWIHVHMQYYTNVYCRLGKFLWENLICSSARVPIHRSPDHPVIGRQRLPPQRLSLDVDDAPAMTLLSHRQSASTSALPFPFVDKLAIVS